MALEQAHRGTCTPKGPGGGGRDRKLPASLPAAPGSGARAPPPPGCPPSRRQLLQLFPVLHELRQTLLDLLLPDGVVVGQLLSSVQDTLTDENEGLTARPCFSMLPENGFSTAFRAAPSWLGMRRPKRRRDRREMNTSKGLRGAWRGPTYAPLPARPEGPRAPELRARAQPARPPAVCASSSGSAHLSSLGHSPQSSPAASSPWMTQAASLYLQAFSWTCLVARAMKLTDGPQRPFTHIYPALQEKPCLSSGK